ITTRSGHQVRFGIKLNNMKLLFPLALSVSIIFNACSEGGKAKKLNPELVVEDADSLENSGSLLYDGDCEKDGHNVHVYQKDDVFNVYSAEGDNEWFLFRATECNIR